MASASRASSGLSPTSPFSDGAHRNEPHPHAISIARTLSSRVMVISSSQRPQIGCMGKSSVRPVEPQGGLRSHSKHLNRLCIDPSPNDGYREAGSFGTARTGTGQCGSVWTTTIALTLATARQRRGLFKRSRLTMSSLGGSFVLEGYSAARRIARALTAARADERRRGFETPMRMRRLVRAPGAPAVMAKWPGLRPLYHWQTIDGVRFQSYRINSHQIPLISDDARIRIDRHGDIWIACVNGNEVIDCGLARWLGQWDRNGSGCAGQALLELLDAAPMGQLACMLECHPEITHIDDGAAAGANHEMVEIALRRPIRWFSDDVAGLDVRPCRPLRLHARSVYRSVLETVLGLTDFFVFLVASSRRVDLSAASCPLFAFRGAYRPGGSVAFFGSL